MGCASIFLVLVLATFVQCSAGKYAVVGTVRIFNNGPFTIEHASNYQWHGGNFQEGVKLITPNSLMKYDVLDGVTCVEGSYTAAGQTLSLTILDWCQTGMPVECLPDCFWIVDNTGFRVAGIDGALLTPVFHWGA